MANLTGLFRLPRDMAVSMFARFFILGTGFVAVLLASRLYGPEAVGQYGLVAAILAATSVLSLGGAELLAQKAMAPGAADRATAFSGSLIQIIFGSTIVGLGIFALALTPFGQRYAASLGAGLAMALPLLVVVNAFRVFLFEVVRAAQTIVIYSLLLCAGPLLLVMLLAAHPFLFGERSFGWAVAGTEALSLMLVLVVMGLMGSAPRLVWVGWNKFWEVQRQARPFFVTTFSVATNQFDVLLLGAFVAPAELGVYVIASRIAIFAGLPLVTSSVGYASKVGRIYADEGAPAALEYSRLQTRAIAPLALLIGAAIILAAPLIAWVFSVPLMQIFPVLGLLVASHLLLAGAGQAGLFLVMCDGQKLQQWVFFSSSALMIGLLLVLAPQLGAVGGALALVCGSLLRSVWGSLAIRSRFSEGISVVDVFWRSRTRS